MLNMLNVRLEKGPTWAHIFPQTLNIFNILNISRVLRIFWESPLNTLNIFNTTPVLSTFRQKYLTFPQFREPRVTKLGKC